MKLPNATPISAEALSAVAVRYRLQFDRVVPFPETGIINTVYALGNDYVLRVPRNHPAHAAQAYREAVAIPATVAAGVRTPRLIAFDDAKDILPVPYLIVERVPGVNLESVDGWLSPTEARWLGRWLDRLAPAATHPVPRRFVPGDVQMSNVLVDLVSSDDLALVDWGCAHWADCAFDFLAMPLRAVPLLLAGHREITPFDDEAEGVALIITKLDSPAGGRI